MGLHQPGHQCQGRQGCLWVTWIMSTLLKANRVSLRPGLDLEASGHAHSNCRATVLSSCWVLCLECVSPVLPGSGKDRGSFVCSHSPRVMTSLEGPCEITCRSPSSETPKPERSWICPRKSARSVVELRWSVCSLSPFQMFALGLL